MSKATCFISHSPIFMNGTFTYQIIYKIPNVDDRRKFTGHVNLIR